MFDACASLCVKKLLNFSFAVYEWSKKILLYWYTIINASSAYIQYPRNSPMKVKVDILDPRYFAIEESVDILNILY